MPTYDYECLKGHRFELFQKMSDDPVTACPECGADAQRLISGGAGFLFKGEGFYITDYRSDEYKKKASAEPGAPSSGPGGDGASSGSGGAADSKVSAKDSDSSGSKGTSSPPSGSSSKSSDS
ncbi:MAG: zinc ribbon domain-containing protein [Gemmatimonadetes bacterium]|nr:zinc ribbon domain-containing protein [Gemmatimonadota bacterium]NNF14510.1 zinc ribbon domain-containing protein [Gemmatimonadota bacterium]NNL29725.1 zinc ribbon domain-containing protein [Gemmatimonadota bacterium]